MREDVVDRLRTSILAGVRRPGDRLDEIRLGHELAVSRNTLREAFRVLAHEHLVEHRPHRGVFVRRLSLQEARDVYRTRRLLECGALREAALRLDDAGRDGTTRERVTAAQEASITAVDRAIADGERGRSAGDWEAVGTANGSFHLALASLAGNAVIDRTLRSLLTEMRLVFVALGEGVGAEEVHGPWVDENARIAGLLAAGQLVRAAVVLEDYLLRAEHHLVGLYGEHLPS